MIQSNQGTCRLNLFLRLAGSEQEALIFDTCNFTEYKTYHKSIHWKSNIFRPRFANFYWQDLKTPKIKNSYFSPVKYNVNSSDIPQVPETDNVIKMMSPWTWSLLSSGESGRESTKKDTGIGINFYLFQSPNKHSPHTRLTFRYIIQPHTTRHFMFSHTAIVWLQAWCIILSQGLF